MAESRGRKPGRDEAEDTESIKPILPQILGAIFQLMGEVDAEELVFTLETLVQKFGTDIAPYAAQMMAQLVAAFNKYMAAVDEEDDEDEGTASIAAYECLRAINTLLDSLSGLGPELYLAIEDALLPLVMKLLSTDGQDVVEEVLEMLAYLTFFGPGITPKLWSTWPLMHAMLMDWAIDSWDSFLIPLDNMITRDTHTFLHSKEPNYLESVFQLVSHSLSGDYSDKEVVPAAKLLQLVLQTCRGSIDNWVGPYIGLALQRLPRTEHNSLKDALVQVVAAALYYNPLLTLRVLVESGTLASFFSGWVTMILATRASSGKAVHFRSMQDKKVCILGLLAL
ncbi:importin N-terminal domain-containing protein [Haematococcus lacustris]|uniref:Importin N-terminal domain-containing protein n=1 Tax=Haematococcus lacustris TaxID=44745 RepID=A0A699YJJ2_HAELA|nr:importin N-terminal domain-containing protein [Haematococcus lacustris]